MPSRPLKPCPVPGCPELVRIGYCPAHSEQKAAEVRQYDEQRGSPAARGYDAEWQAFRRAYLHQHPWCRQCGERAVDLDHVVELRDGGARLDPSNVQPLCRRHHLIKTAQARKQRDIARRPPGPEAR